jgi:hypothetical protein
VIYLPAFLKSATNFKKERAKVINKVIALRSQGYFAFFGAKRAGQQVAEFFTFVESLLLPCRIY